MLNKKAQMKMIVAILLVILGFFLLASLIHQYFSKAEGKTAEAICKGSVVARETVRLNLGVAQLKTVPLLCYSEDISITPTGRTDAEQRDSVMRQVANKMVSCWQMFGEGSVPNIFKDTQAGDNKCSVCYTFDIKKGSKINGDINGTDFLKFWDSTVYNVESDSEECMNSGGFCIADTDKDKNEIQTASKSNTGWKLDKFNSVCKDKYKDSNNAEDRLRTGCYYNSYPCLNNGGACEASCSDGKSPLPSDYWSCPSEGGKSNVCCVPTGKYFTYHNYIQFHGSKGLSFISTDLKGGSLDRYAIAFGEVNKEGCGAACWFTAIGGGAVVVGGTLLGGAVALIPVPGIAQAAGGYIIATAWVVGGSMVVASAATVGIVEIEKLVMWRDLPTVYLSRVDDIGKTCSISKK